MNESVNGRTDGIAEWDLTFSDNDRVADLQRLALLALIDEQRLAFSETLPCPPTEDEIKNARIALRTFGKGLRRIMSVLL